MPAGSKTDPLLAKAKPSSDSGSTPVITFLRRKIPPCVTAFAARERGENSADTNEEEVRKEGQEVLPGTRDSPVDHGKDLGETGCPPAAHGGPWWSRWVPEGGCDPMGSSHWSRLLPGPVEP